MTEPFDVSLRVKLDYQAGSTAKAAVADIEAFRRAAQQLGTPAAGTLAKELGSIAAQAKEAERVIANIRDAAKRHAAEGNVADAARNSAKTAVDAFEREFGKLHAARNTARMLGGVADQAAKAQREISGIGRSADALAAASGPRIVQREIGALGVTAKKTRLELEEVRKEAEKFDAANSKRTPASGSGHGGPGASGGGHAGRSGFSARLSAAPRCRSAWNEWRHSRPRRAGRSGSAVGWPPTRWSECFRARQSGRSTSKAPC